MSTPHSVVPFVRGVFADVLPRAASALPDVPTQERADAERVLELVRLRHVGESFAEPERRELLGLVERLGRRASASVPFATLARAVSADIHGAEGVRDESLAAWDRSLQLRGL